MESIRSMPNLPLMDSFGRVHNSLRISVTDRCNIRCFYCMAPDQVLFLPRTELLTFEEWVRLVRILAKRGVDRLRLTGGEPLVRSGISDLVRMLKAIPGIREVAMTTNAVLLCEQAEALRDAGLDRLNISLDALDRTRFMQITRRDVLDRVLAGIERALEVGFTRTRLNTVAVAGVTEAEILPLAQFALERGLELRFIEYMPLDAERAWESQQVLTGSEILERISAQYGPVEPAPRPDESQPARDYFYAGHRGRLGLIHPVSEPFCGTCNRLRITAEGKMRNCLFSTDEWDLRTPLRDGKGDTEILNVIESCVQAKKAGHLIGKDEFQQPSRTMHQIGG